MAFVIYNSRHFDDPSRVVGDARAYAHILHDTTLDKTVVEAFIDRVYDLAKYVELRENFGLTVIDLFELDYASFVEVEERIAEIRKHKAPIEAATIQEFKKLQGQGA